MNGKLKVLGLAFIAALALTAVLASVASAQFTSDKEHTIISGSQREGTNDVFTAGSGFGGVTCENVTFSGTLSGTNSSALEITPTYSVCKDSFGRTVHVHNKLKWKFTFDEIVGGTPIGTLHVTEELTTTTTSGGSVVCTTTIKPSTLNGVIYHQNNKRQRFTIHSTEVVSTTSGGFFNCGISNGEHKNGTYDGEEDLKGEGTEGSEAELTIP
jgi:hypothetical protein